MLVLSEEDRRLIKDLREFGVFQNIEGHRIDQSNGAVVVCCADADQFQDGYNHHCQIQLQQRRNPRIHPLSWNGGAMTCIENSPVNRLANSYIEFLGQITDARILKGINPVLVETHAPCGAAHLHKISLANQLAIHVEAKKNIRALNPDATLACTFHVDYGNSKRRYFFSRPRWEIWLQDKKIQVAV
jgi:hypothetical protein